MLHVHVLGCIVYLFPTQHMNPAYNGCHFVDKIVKQLFVTENVCILIWISIKVISEGPTDNKSSLVQVMAWHLSGDKPLHEPVMTQFTDAYMHHLGSNNWPASVDFLSIQAYICQWTTVKPLIQAAP